MSDLGAPTVLDELLVLWRLASSAERVAFLQRVREDPPPPVAELRRVGRENGVAQLRHAWRRATPAERQRFAAWLREQPEAMA